MAACTACGFLSNTATLAHSKGMFVLTFISNFFLWSSFGISNFWQAYGPESEESFVCSGGRENYGLVYANGMRSSRENAEHALESLKKATGFSYSHYEVAHNQKELFLFELVEVFYQKAATNEKFLWSYISDLSGPAWFNDLIRSRVRRLTEDQYSIDKDLDRHIQLYESLFQSGLKVIVVSHSQGNFYANTAHEFLTLKAGGEEISDRFKIVGVASPASYVGGKGPYRTLFSDAVIDLIPAALPPNVRNDVEGSLDHLFVEHYLERNPSGSEILDLIRLGTQSKTGFFVSGYLDKSLDAMNEWVGSLARAQANKQVRLGLPEEISRTQCLAMQIFFFLGDWFNANCEDKTLSHLADYAWHCFQAEWSRTSSAEFDCNLVGLNTSVFAGYASHAYQSSYSENYPSCLWDSATVHRDMTKELLEAALRFIETPSFPGNSQ